jgi:tetratricopeptide (TPR) repeat protein
MLGDHARALPDYAKAIDTARPDLRATAQYDRGNTLYRLGRLEDARDAYRESLRLSPSDRDAKFNLELVQRLLDLRVPQPQNGAQPGASGSPGATGPGGQGATAASGPTSSLKPGEGATRPSGDQGQPPADDRAPGQGQPQDLRSVLNDFRKGLTLDDALRVLDALEGQQRGIEQLLEGPRRATPGNPEY